MASFKDKLAALGPGGWAILAGMAALALIVAFVIVPMIAESTGTADADVSFMTGALFFAIAIGCAAAVKIMAKRAKKNG